jgi:hypothetical protein
VDGDRVVNGRLGANRRNVESGWWGRLAAVIDDGGVGEPGRACLRARVGGRRGSGVAATMVDECGVGEASRGRRGRAWRRRGRRGRAWRRQDRRGRAWRGRGRRGRAWRGRGRRGRAWRRQDRRGRAWHGRGRRGRTWRRRGRRGRAWRRRGRRGRAWRGRGRSGRTRRKTGSRRWERNRIGLEEGVKIGGWGGASKGKHIFVEVDMTRDDDAVGGEVQTPVPLVVRRVAKE